VNQIMAAVFGGLIVVSASTAVGQESGTLLPNRAYMPVVGSAADGSPPDQAAAFPSLTFGGLDIGVWAPVEPPYDSQANRDPSGESFWGID
jgi:hypothetical protein